MRPVTLADGVHIMTINDQLVAAVSLLDTCLDEEIVTATGLSPLDVLMLRYDMASASRASLGLLAKDKPTEHLQCVDAT